MVKKERSTISSSVFHYLIRNLEVMSIVKDYGFLDPIYEDPACLEFSWAFIMSSR